MYTDITKCINIIKNKTKKEQTIQGIRECIFGKDTHYELWETCAVQYSIDYYTNMWLAGVS